MVNMTAIETRDTGPIKAIYKYKVYNNKLE